MFCSTADIAGKLNTSVILAVAKLSSWRLGQRKRSADDSGGEHRFLMRKCAQDTLGSATGVQNDSEDVLAAVNGVCGGKWFLMKKVSIRGESLV